MALKVLMLRKRLNDANKQLEALRSKDEEFVTREADLEKSIEEAETEEERSAVEEAITEFETEKAAHADQKADLERQIQDLEDQIAEEEKQQNTDPEEDKPEERTQDMGVERVIEAGTKRSRIMEMVKRENVQAYLMEVRNCIREKRSLTNVGLTIPEVFLGILRENIAEYSKLYKHVTVRQIGGDGRMVIMGTIPEAVWTDCCANLNELDLGFADMELDCWKVGGYFAVCNANLEDSDVDLASEIVTALGQAIGRALDKAILYGGGTRMPLGIVPRLAQTSKPAGYPDTAREWVDLHTTNIKTTSNTGVTLFADLVTNFGAAKGKYSRGEIVHVMNEKTYTYLMAQAMSVNAAGAIVSGVNGVMPVIGGVIEVLDFVPDNNIVSGYYDLYILAERGGQKFASSEHVKFLSDQTVFKGTARYDGAPAIAEGFVVNAIGGSSAGTSMDFAADDANDVTSIMVNATAASVAVNETLQLVAFTAPGVGPVEWTTSSASKATVGSTTGIVTGVASGSATITATCNGLSATCAVTVTAS